jgi:cold shock CspA family protein
LIRWNDAKGFGFIPVQDRGRDIFVPISAFKKMAERRPRMGDTVYFDLHRDNRGKLRAVNAGIMGVTLPPVHHRPVKPAIAKGGYTGGVRRWVSRRLTSSVLLLGDVFAYHRYQVYTGRLQNGPVHKTEVTQRPADSDTTRYSCRGKVYCSGMRSCEEAILYLRNCPGTKMDGDRDGIPCVRQWCRY